MWEGCGGEEEGRKTLPIRINLRTAEMKNVGKGFTPFLRATPEPSIAQVSPEKWR